MGIVNNISSNMILGELNKNTKKKSKASAQLALGEKIRNAGDDASGYAISEKMRVRIRALEQDEANVKNGASMLRTAEGAIQSQINLLRTIKAKVIDAHNDTNTDVDRAIIQKEISQYYDEINDIAAETTFNKKLLLLGDTVQETVSSWRILDKAVLVEGSDSLNLIPDNFGDLDEQIGPFDTFGSDSDSVKYDGYNVNKVKVNSIPGYDTQAASDPADDSKSFLHGATTSQAKQITIDLSTTPISALNNASFAVKYHQYLPEMNFVLTDDTNAKYVDNSVVIDISGKTNKNEIAAAIANTVKGKLSSYYDVSVDSVSNEKVVFTVKASAADSNDTDKYNIYGLTGMRQEAITTGLGDFHLENGQNAEYRDEYDPATDKPKSVIVKYPTYATISKDISGVADNSGITLKAGKAGEAAEFTEHVIFVSGNNPPEKDPSTGCVVVGKNCTGSYSFGNSSYGGMRLDFSGGTMKLTSLVSGETGNSYSVTDGITQAKTTTALGGITEQEGIEGGYAYWNWDLSGYNTSDMDKAEAFIDALVGKGFSRGYYIRNNGYPYLYELRYEFIDSGKAPAIESIYKLNGYNIIDLDTLRKGVEGGKTVSKAFADLLTPRVGTYGYVGSEYKFIKLTEEVKDSSDATIGLKFRSYTAGKIDYDPNNTSESDVLGLDADKEYISFREGDLRDYTIDFASFFGTNGDIAATLDGKGVRFYCATDKSQWVNLQFVNGISPVADDRPKSGTGSQDIKTFVVDVSDVTDVQSLVKTIYEGDGNKNPQGLADWLINDYKHMFELAADYDKGTITIYDKRRFTVLNDSSFPDKQSHGAKIADGVLDNIVEDVRHIYVNDLVIHHTDRASANIHVRIPQTTMDHIFGYKVGTYSLDDYSVMTSEKREKLLGTDGPPKVEGTLDKGLQYLIDANTLIGAQIVHMEHAEANIITDQESTMSAESVIRDADMAKSSLDLATAEILAQSGQAMLSQSNQNSSNVLNLLQ
ncbi:Flagellin protein FlaA [Anaerovibrio sp. JC8]|uniref:flagellin N-terminal helical domain-containing protein n=1 Tax=Anaerovibrio sp. JC8 TaxID=1240085 RepID=UPI000A0B8B92|nr:flagellin [Anaerovibrio sp. JC8]ORU00516.1 Flagellin protein FlaA [Anaerovibrio sp. JC8]